MVVLGPLSRLPWGTEEEWGRVIGDDRRAELREALREKMRVINEVTATSVTLNQAKDTVTLTVEGHQRIKRAMDEAREIKALLELADRTEEVVETYEVMTMESATPVRTIEVRRPRPPEQIPPEVWAEAARRRAEDDKRRAAERAEQDRLERLRQVRKACETAAASFEKWAWCHRAPDVKRWHRWWFSPRVIREREAAFAAGIEAEQARHVLAAELRNTADLPDDILEWLLGEGWRPPKPEVWHFLD